MGILKDLTKEYFGEKVRKEDEIDIFGLEVDIVSFKDNNGKYHERGYKPNDRFALKNLLKRMIEVRGDEGDFNDIDTSEIKYMFALFYGNKTFNGNISGWDVSSVKNMSFMFRNATSFNQPIGNWEFPNVIYMGSMFEGASSFNQDLSSWDLTNVNKKEGIFENCPIKDEFKPKME